MVALLKGKQATTDAVQAKIDGIRADSAAAKQRQAAIERELSDVLANGGDGDLLEQEHARLTARLAAYALTLLRLQADYSAAQAREFVATYTEHAKNSLKERQAAGALQPRINELLEEVRQLEIKRLAHERLARHEWDITHDMLQAANRAGNVAAWGIDSELAQIRDDYFN